ncbi:MAG: threonine/serine dehydratase [Maricaulaceae bacterium]
MSNITIPTYSDVLEAKARLSGHALPTPMLRSDVLDNLTGKALWFKPECSQKVGAFKYRGAYNRLSAMSAVERSKGVVAYSSGNHAQGVSRAAKELGIDAIIVMPEDAPSVKVAGVKADGATIRFYDRLKESRESIAAEVAARDQRIIVPSFDDPFIIAGQGTVGFEVAQEAAVNNIKFDSLITCVGGGGLCAGISLAMNELSPHTRIFGAEPRGYNDHQISLSAGQRVSLDNPPPTLCDALMTPQPGELTFAINQQSLSDVFDVSDEECLLAMAIIKRELDVQLEPGGAVAAAASLFGRFDAHSDINTICIILSGGNVDPEIAKRADALLT